LKPKRKNRNPNENRTKALISNNWEARRERRYRDLISPLLEIFGGLRQKKLVVSLD